LGGTGRVATAGGSFTAEAGDVILVPPKMGHVIARVDQSAHWQYRWVYFQPRGFWAPWLQWTETQVGVGRLRLKDDAKRTRIASLFEQIEEVSTSKTATSDELAMN